MNNGSVHFKRTSHGDGQDQPDHHHDSASLWYHCVTQFSVNNYQTRCVFECALLLLAGKNELWAAKALIGC